MLAVMVSAEVPEVLIVAALKVAERPRTSLIPSKLRLTVPLKLKGITLTLKTAVPARVSVCEPLSMMNQ